MSLPLPTPPSNSFEDNVDLLIQDLLKNMAGINYSPAQIMQRSGRDRAIIFQVLENLKIFSQYAVQGDWVQLDNTAPDYIKNKPIINTQSICAPDIDCGFILNPNSFIDIDLNHSYLSCNDYGNFLNIVSI